MIRSKSQQTQSMISGINITPFTDVCLVLLIIFLVTANTLTRENNVQLKLPSADSTSTKLPERIPIVHIAKDQKIYVNDGKTAIRQEQLREVLQTLYDKDPSSPKNTIVEVRADENVPYSLVFFAIDQAHLVGLDDIALAARDSGTSGSARSAPAPSRPAKAATAQTGAVKTASAQSGTAKPASVQTVALKTAPVQSGTAKPASVKH